MRFLANILAKAGLIVDGTTQLNTINNATIDTDKFLVSDGGVIKYRTGAQLGSDIGAANLAASTLKHQVKLGEAINKGQAVYVSSAHGTNMIVSKASNASEATSSKTLGLIETSGVLNDQVNVVTEGLLAGLDTSTAAAGDPVWLGTGGNLIFGLANKPYAPAHLVFIGIVTRVQQSNGEIFVKVQNGFELKEIHDVQITTTPSDNTVLAYESATSLYKMKSIATLLGYTPADDSLVVHKAGTETITGVKTFNAGLTLPNYVAINLSNSARIEGYDGKVLFRTVFGAAGWFQDNSLYLAAMDNITATSNIGVLVKDYTGEAKVGYKTPAQMLTYLGAQGALTLTTTGTSGAATLVGNTLNIPNYAPDLSGYVPTSRTLTINGTAYDLTANRSWSVGTVTSVGLSSATSGVTIGSTPITTSGTITLAIATASGTQQGLLSSTDWTTFNNKQNALTNPVTGTGNANRIAMFTGTSTIGNSSLYYDATYQNIGIKTAGGPITFKNYSALSFDVNAISGNSTTLQLTRNVLEFDGWLYLNGSAPAMFQITGGNDFTWSNSTSGTAGTTITWNERMRLDASGNLGLGTSSPTDAIGYGRALDIQSSTGAAVYLKDSDATSVYGFLAYDGVANRTNLGAIGASNYLRFISGGSEKMILDASGNLGLGVTPSAWSVGGVLQVANTTGTQPIASSGIYNALSANLYYNAGWKYATTGNALLYSQEAGVHAWYNAVSGTAGNAVTLTQAMTLDASGRLGIGTTSPSEKLEVEGRIKIRSGYALYLSNGDNTATSAIVNGESTSTSSTLFYTGGAERMRITSGGNVGIGTTSPTSLLHSYSSTSMNQLTVDGAGAIKSGINFANGGVIYGQIYFDNNAPYNMSILQQYFTGSLILGTNNTERMRITSGGALLVNTTSTTNTAAGKIVNRLGGTSDPDLALNGGAWSIASIGGEPALYLSSNIVAATGLNGSTQTAKGGIGFEYYSSTSPTELSIGIFGTPTVASNIRFWNNGAERMRITSGGNVGIGTTSPTQRLESALSSSGGVATSLRITNSSAASVSAGQGVQMEFANDNAFSSSSSSSAIRSITTNTTNGAADLLFLNWNGSASTERMRITSGGNVGIGTTSPSYRLTVIQSTSGNIAYLGQTFTNQSSLNALLLLQSGTIPQYGSDKTGEAGLVFNHAYGTGGVNGNSNGGYIKSIRESVFGTTSQVNTAIVFATTAANTDNERIRITSGGNVGIGTTNPSYKFEVIGNSYFDSNMLIGNGSELRMAVTGINIKPALVGGNWKDMVFTTASAEAMRITGNGEVCVGQTTAYGAGWKLNVNGNAYVAYDVYAGTGIQTGAPTGGTSKKWKLGSVVAGSVTYDANNYVEVEINGTAYTLALATPS